MAKKTYWKDIRKSFGSSKGRFLSIMLLMMLGAFAFVGLKVTGPDMQATASQYLKNIIQWTCLSLQVTALVMLTKKN